MAWKDCKDCKGTGQVEAETISMSRPYYSKEHKQVVRDTYGHGDWHLMQCHCVGEEEYLAENAS